MTTNKWDKEWLCDVKAGDEIVVINRGVSYLRTVDRVTKTQIVIGDTRFNRTGSSAGHSRGGNGWHSQFLQNADPEEVERVRAEQRRRVLIALLNRVNWNKIPMVILEQVAETLQITKKTETP